VSGPGTPLPWIAEESEDNPGFWTICPATYSGDITYLTLRPAHERAANAAYIVTAANAYPTLLEEVKALREALEPFAGHLFDPCGIGYGNLQREDFVQARTTLARFQENK
jgi:hypothetical protein